MAYDKTTNLQLDKIADDNIFDVSVITENFEKIDDAFGKIKPDTKDTDVTCTARSNKKLNEVLGEVAYKGEILPQHIKGNDDKRIYKYVSIFEESTDNAHLFLQYIKDNGASVTEKKYIKNWGPIKNLKETMEQYKSAVDEYSRNLGVFVERHKTANDSLDSLLGRR